MASLGRTGLVPESVRRLRTTDVTDAQLIARSVRVRLTLTATCMLFRFFEFECVGNGLAAGKIAFAKKQ